MKHVFMSLSLGKKLILALLLAGLVPMAIVTIQSLIVARSEVSKQAFNQLEAVREIKTEAIQRYFQQVESQIMTEAASNSVIAATRELSASFARMAA